MTCTLVTALGHYWVSSELINSTDMWAHRAAFCRRSSRQITARWPQFFFFVWHRWQEGERPQKKAKTSKARWDAILSAVIISGNRQVQAE